MTLDLDALEQRLRSEREKQQKTNPVSAFMNLDAPALIAELRSAREDCARYRGYCEEWALKDSKYAQENITLRRTIDALLPAVGCQTIEEAIAAFGKEASKSGNE